MINGRDECGGLRWWCALPDRDAATPLARLLAAEVDTVVAHGSGRPWLVAKNLGDTLRTVAVGPNRVSMIGTHLASETQWRVQVEHAVRHGDYDALAAVGGSFHVAVSTPDTMVFFGDVAGFRRVFTCRVAGTTVVSSHADVLRRLAGAPVSRTWLAARLTCPEMPSPLRESLSPFEGVAPIPAGHRLTVAAGAVRHAAYWTPPPANRPCADGAPILAEALIGAVGGRARTGGGLVSVQLSGGLDSTAVSCLAADGLGDRSALLLVTTASISPGNDDLDWARRVAEHLAPAEHVVLPAGEFPRFFDDVPMVVSGMDEPAPFTAASARVRHLATLLASRGVRLHVNGQGGDEVLLAPLVCLRDTLRASPWLGWRHLRGQAALHGLRLPRLARSVLHQPTYAHWLRWTAGALRTEAAPEVDAVGWEAQPLLPPWASRDTERLVRTAILAATPTTVADHGTHSALVRIRSTAYRASLYRDALAGHGVPAEFPFFDRAVLDAALAVRPWERTDPWQPKPLLRAALTNTMPARLLARRTKAHYNDDIYRGWTANRHLLASLFEQSRLAELGLIDANALRHGLRSFGPSGLAPAFVTDTIACELWLRSLAPPFAHRQEHDHVQTKHERFAGPGSLHHHGIRRHDHPA